MRERVIKRDKHRKEGEKERVIKRDKHRKEREGEREGGVVFVQQMLEHISVM